MVRRHLNADYTARRTSCFPIATTPTCLPVTAVCPPSALAIGLARVGQGAEQRIVAGTLAELQDVDFGPPLHSLVLVGGAMHDLEAAMFEHYRWRAGPEGGAQWKRWVDPDLHDGDEAPRVDDDDEQRSH